jgi:hypothetical protein
VTIEKRARAYSASESFKKLNPGFYNETINNQSSREATLIERPAREESLVSNKGKKADTARYFVSLTSVRKRLLDTDNLVAKYHVDALRYASLLPSDAPNRAEIKVSQRKCKEKEEEHIEIELFEL